MKLSFIQNSLNDVIAKYLIPQLSQFSILTFQGSLGAGKTTLIKQLLKQCGIHENTTSPTFGYVNSYTNDQGVTFHHFDLYRINSIETFLALGLEEYFYQKNSICLIEWPEVIVSLLQQADIVPRVLSILLTYDAHIADSRIISIGERIKTSLT